MRLLTGKRIGQSGGELTAAVSFSLFLHAVALIGALYLSFHSSARVTIPPFYRVNLVDLPANAPVTEPAAPAAASPRAPEPKTKQPAPRAKQPAVHAVPKLAPVPAAKEAMPEPGAAKPKQEKAVETPQAPPVQASGGAAGTAGKKQEAVAVSVPGGGGQAFPFPPYVAIVRDKVERNWNPPPGAKGLKARVTFTVLRSGRVGDSKLEAASGNFYFDQAAMRAILASSPFPPLPEGFFRDDEVFSVDLMERE
jgi:TonB family protein